MPTKKTEEIISKIRECCDYLAALEERFRHDAGVTAAMRAVMEALHLNGALTVPQIARARKVTRQHIQVIADKLVAGALALTQENPSDRRSPLLRLTTQGEAIFERMRQRESDVLAELTRALRDYDLDAAMRTLDALQVWLGQRVNQSEALGD